MTGFGVAALLFSVLVIAVRVRWVPLESLDRGVVDGLNALVAPHRPLVTLMGGISRLGSFGILAWLIAIAATLLLVRRRLRLASFLVATALGGLVLDPTLKLAVGRLRPVVERPVAHGGGNSFPSGHALNSFICYAALLVVFLPALPARWRRPALLAGGVLVLLIGFSRLALGVHFLSDVIGGWSLGAAWVGLCAAAFELVRHESGKRVTAPLAEGLEPEAARDLHPAAPGRAPAEAPRRLWAVAGLAVAWVLTLGALVAVGLPLARYQHGNGNVLGDHAIPHWFAAHRDAALERITATGSDVGNTHAILAIGLVVGAVALAVARRWRPVVFLLTVMFGELTLFLASAAIAGRARPDVPNMDGQLPTSSYPSGHVAATICLWAAAALLVLPRTRAWWRWLFVAAAVLMPLWVAVARLYRGEHHPTDILGSVLLAGLWVPAAWWLLRPNADVTEHATARPAPATARPVRAAP
ncbi:phosphatase PAP2 family protein [Dactylosporangium salmoneum]|uniref:Phosphatidic acid phosphatase type 2/haloperoxidase domain-containing protein n=1 Tax=Dactylosporangium salmoneum TaxID=53361 RepID=A0ABN3GBW0_9ACTN